jgi:carbon storage regulator
MIGDDIEVSVLAVSRDKIRIGITAPKEVPVFRKEVWISIKEEAGEDVKEEAKGEVHKGARGKEAEGDEQNRNGIEEAIIEGAAAQVEEALGRKE